MTHHTAMPTNVSATVRYTLTLSRQIMHGPFSVNTGKEGTLGLAVTQLTVRGTDVGNGQPEKAEFSCMQTSTCEKCGVRDTYPKESYCLLMLNKCRCWVGNGLGGEACEWAHQCIVDGDLCVGSLHILLSLSLSLVHAINL